MKNTKRKYKRNRAKDLVIVIVWSFAILPIIPAVIVLLLSALMEKLTDLHDDIFLSPIRKWRNKWNPIKEDE